MLWAPRQGKPKIEPFFYRFEFDSSFIQSQRCEGEWRESETKSTDNDLLKVSATTRNWMRRRIRTGAFDRFSMINK